jgi:hypothetical protein
MIVMNLPSMMHEIVGGIEVEMWWKIQIERVIGSPNSQTYFDNASKDEDSKEPMEKPLTQMRLKNRTKKNLMCMNIFYHGWKQFGTCYNNLAIL